MKVRNFLIPLIALSTPMAFAEVLDNKSYSSELDKIRGETDIWASKANLESTKKTALTDTIENMNLEEMVRERESSRTSGSKNDGSNPISQHDFYNYAMKAEFYSKQDDNESEQEGILDINGVPVEDTKVENESSKAYDELKKQQESFFKQVQEYLSDYSESQHEANTEASEYVDEAMTVETQNINSESIQATSGKEVAPKAFEYDTSATFDNFSAKIASRTKRTIEIAFAIGVAGSKPAYLMETITPKTKDFDLHFFGIKTIPVKVLSVDDGSVTLEIDGKKILAK
ncbi:hypothetical protein [Vibrio sp. D431a]|uniref:hypothetical protein n=1 Tax=Vibrio sp. D431a TaxID=2837388 RepID=UPI002556DD3E|nr:hypothetical protein [Vibrio sp. D431a]MDK9793836.1 hypothetical protein [Vibrio sp. D431a]